MTVSVSLFQEKANVQNVLKNNFPVNFSANMLPGWRMLGHNVFAIVAEILFFIVVCKISNMLGVGEEQYQPKSIPPMFAIQPNPLFKRTEPSMQPQKAF